MKLLIADDHALLRKSLIRTIQHYDAGLELYEASDGKEALNMLQLVNPHIILLDISMPVLNGVEVARTIRGKGIDCKIIILTQFNNASLILNLVKIGVDGFVSKITSPEELIECINKVALHGQYFDASIQEIIFTNIKNIDNLPAVHYSVREYEIITLLKNGKSSKEISTALNLSPHSIDTYRKALMKKTKTDNIAQLISYSYEVGIF